MIAYTDGGCIPNPGFGGWGYVVVDLDGIVDCASGSEVETTNNRMEYLALINVVEVFGHMLTQVHTDSMLLVDTCMTWRHSWKKKNWKRCKKNLDLVLRIDELLERHPHIEVLWVKGHNGNPFNEAADELANKAALQAYRNRS